jgi:hypothetical protein
VFSAPDCSKMALAWGGILGCPFVVVYVTAPMMIVEIPSATRGVEFRMK